MSCICSGYNSDISWKFNYNVKKNTNGVRNSCLRGGRGNGNNVSHERDQKIKRLLRLKSFGHRSKTINWI